MNFVKSLSMFHVDAKEIPCLTGKGAPSAQTEGAPGVLYMDTDTGGMYKCTAADYVNVVFTWKPLCSSDSSQNGNQGTGLTTTEKTHLLTILDAVIVETSKQSAVSEALNALKSLWSGGEVYVSQNGTVLALNNVTAVTSITQTGTVLALA